MAEYRKAKEINESSPWEKLTEGLMIYEPATSESVMTGEWRTSTPQFIEEDCKQCLLCVPVCPDSAIPVVNRKRLDFDYDHCKGCGICVKVCPFDAIKMEGLE
ncbi:MAG: 4Fe-4S binding protein [Eubacterium sp.]|nr:4Fe-4S binding protein [Eubacterium sp.]